MMMGIHDFPLIWTSLALPYAYENWNALKPSFSGRPASARKRELLE
jgi:hypothetical protein